MTDFRFEHLRFGFGNKSTLGQIILEGKLECFLLEDERRRIKVPGKTCLPLGTYEITLRTEGDMHEDYLRRFPGIHVGMLWIRNVPNFTYAYYHIGNTHIHTEGCPLTGTTPNVDTSGEFEVWSSERAYLPFYKKIAPKLLGGTRVFVEIKEAEPL